MNRREFAGGLAGFVAALQVKLPMAAPPVPDAVVAEAVAAAAAVTVEGLDGPMLLPLEGLMGCMIHFGEPIDVTAMGDSHRRFMPAPPGSEELELRFSFPYPLAFDACAFDREIRVDLRQPPAKLGVVMVGMLVSFRDNVVAFGLGTRELVIRPTEPVVWS